MIKCFPLKENYILVIEKIFLILIFNEYLDFLEALITNNYFVIENEIKM